MMIERFEIKPFEIKPFEIKRSEHMNGSKTPPFLGRFWLALMPSRVRSEELV